MSPSDTEDVPKSRESFSSTDNVPEQSPAEEAVKEGESQPPASPMVILVHPIIFGKQPVRMNCPYCQVQTTTRLEYDNGTLTWVLAAGLFAFTGIFCFVPFLVNDCKDVKHHCSHCGQMVGVFRRL